MIQSTNALPTRRRTLTAASAALLLAVSFAAPLAHAQGSGEEALRRAVTALKNRDVRGAIAALEPFRGVEGTEPTVQAMLGALYTQIGRHQDALAVLEPLIDRGDPDPAVLYNAGRAAAAAGQSEKGEAYLERSVALSPVSPAARDLGFIRLQQGRIAEAYRLLRPWALMKPDDVEATQAAAAAAIQMARVPEATQLLASLDPEVPQNRILFAQVAMLGGNPSGALEILAPILADPPPAIEREVVRLAADAFLLTGRSEQATDLLAEHGSKSPDLAALLAQAHNRDGRHAEALATLEPLRARIAAQGADAAKSRLAAQILTEYGRAQLGLGNDAAAAEVLEEVVVSHPTYAGGWDALASLRDRQGRAEEAGEARDRAREIAATKATAIARSPNLVTGDMTTEGLERALAVLQAGNPESALALVVAESELAPFDVRPRLMEVRILVSLKRLREALVAAEKAVEVAPDNADALYQRGSVRFALGAKDEAEADFERALELAPQHLPTMNDLAVLLISKGEREEARKLLEQVVALNPNDGLAAQNLEQLKKGGGGG